jgi:hypothetical protein
LTQLTGATVCTAIDTLPETVVPDFGAVILTEPAGVGVPPGVGVGGGGVGVGAIVGVGVVDAPLLTFRLIEVVATNALLLLYPLTEMACSPLATPAEFHAIV